MFLALKPGSLLNIASELPKLPRLLRHTSHDPDNDPTSSYIMLRCAPIMLKRSKTQHCPQVIIKRYRCRMGNCN